MTNIILQGNPNDLQIAYDSGFGMTNIILQGNHNSGVLTIP